MRNAIIACSDEKYGDFLIDHWLRSLVANVDLKNIDVIVLDYGLSQSQLERLRDVLQQIIIFRGTRDGHVNTIRFRDIPQVLSRKEYGQVMSVDGGDVIFQSDISQLFNEHPDTYRAVCERLYREFKKRIMENHFSKEISGKMNAILKDKRQINAGVLLAPASKFHNLCVEVYSLVSNKNAFGPDQHAINYILYRDGFVELDEKYNFIISVSKKPFFIRKGVFCLKSGEIIPIVHNAGARKFFRPVDDFGSGPGRNRLRRIFFFLSGLVMRRPD